MTENADVKVGAAEAAALEKVGADASNLNPGETGAGNPAPAAPSNKAPEKKGDDEEHGTPVDKGPSDKQKEQAQQQQDQHQDDSPDDDESWKNQYIEFEDEAGQSVVNLLNEAGVKPIEANAFFAEAIKADDYTKIRWDLIEARLGKDKAALARIGITHHYENVYKRNTETKAKGYEVVGGEANWNKVSAWVRKTEANDPRQKQVFDEIRRGIDAGGRLAEYAFQDLKKMYEADSNNSGLGVQKVVQGDRGNAEVMGGALTRAAYVAELKAAHDRGARGPEIEAIRARRRAGMQAGI